MSPEPPVRDGDGVQLTPVRSAQGTARVWLDPVAGRTKKAAGEPVARKPRAVVRAPRHDAAAWEPARPAPGRRSLHEWTDLDLAYLLIFDEHPDLHVEVDDDPPQ